MSRDGGRTWAVLSSHGTATIPWGIAAGEGFVVGLDAGLLQTSTLEISTDGGQHWNQATAPFRGRLANRMACRSDGRCVASDGTSLWHGERFGATWSEQANSTPIHEAVNVFYAGDGTLFAVDRMEDPGGTERLLVSSDDGHSWWTVKLP